MTLLAICFADVVFPHHLAPSINTAPLDSKCSSNTLSDTLWKYSFTVNPLNYALATYYFYRSSIWTIFIRLFGLILSEYLAFVNVATILLHELRHTSATLLLANGTDIETVSHRLGHSKASTTLDIYGHAMKKMDSKASDTLESILSNRKKA